MKRDHISGLLLILTNILADLRFGLGNKGGSRGYDYYPSKDHGKHFNLQSKVTEKHGTLAWLHPAAPGIGWLRGTMP